MDAELTALLERVRVLEAEIAKLKRGGGNWLPAVKKIREDIRPLREKMEQRVASKRERLKRTVSVVKAEQRARVETIRSKQRDVTRHGTGKLAIITRRPGESLDSFLKRQDVASTRAYGPPVGHKLAKDLASEHLRLHNAASAEFKEAFKRVGAKMWNGDDAHVLKPDPALTKMYAQAHAGKVAVPVFLGNESHSVGPIAKPLTVLDSFPKVAQDKRKMKQLTTEVDEIAERYRKEWEAFVESKGLLASK